MPAAETAYEHIILNLNEDGVPMIEGTTMKVIELVQEHLAWRKQKGYCNAHRFCFNRQTRLCY